MHKQILPNQYKYVDSDSQNMAIRVSLQNDKHLTQESNFNEIINQYNQYLDERESCYTVRLTAKVNLIANNVLFNHLTEVVKNEDSNDCVCLNFTPKTISSTMGRSSAYKWGSNFTEFTRDTQITSEAYDDKNYIYHCGIDIFNNHILRAKTNFVSIPNTSTGSYSNTGQFNTISSLIYDSNGYKQYNQALTNSPYYTYWRTYYAIPTYRRNDILTSTSVIEKRLETKSGWYGFVNRSLMFGINNNKDMGISRVLNNEPTGKFIDLYPNRNHYSLMPYYNKIRHRKEKNWEYCLTYPYSSTTENISCINSKLGTLRIGFIDESVEDDDGLQKTTIFSVSKHGLQADDIINIYRSNWENTQHAIVESNVIVDTVIDEYTFVVYMAEPICKEWVNVLDSDYVKSIFGSNYNVYTNSVTYGSREIYAYNNYLNGDLDSGEEIGSQNLSFCKVDDDTECKYYVRIFSRFPNFDFLGKEVDEKTIYQDSESGKRNVDIYADEQYEKTSSLTKLGFSKNIYNDDIVQIVFNDDININYLHDNLGRPLTNLYLSFFKTNYGHREWYNGDVQDAYVEHSHCWGPLTCGFKYSPAVFDSQFIIGNINFMNSSNSAHDGLSQMNFRSVYDGYDVDDIYYKKQQLFYGDLCCYSPSQCQETVIQDICNRFNTQQRELKGSGLKGESTFDKDVTFDEFRSDSLYSSRLTTTNLPGSPIQCFEGYYYKANYEIPIRAISGNLSEYEPHMFQLSELNSGSVYTAKTSEINYITSSDTVYLYSKSDSAASKINIINVLSTTVFTFTADDISVVSGGIDSNGKIDKTNYRIYIHPTFIPSYANIAEDGSGVIKWREIYQNGFEDNSTSITEYPFTNNCLYVNKNINIFLRRQDPFGDFGLADAISLSFTDGISSPYRTGVLSSNNGGSDNSYANESDASC